MGHWKDAGLRTECEEKLVIVKVLKKITCLSKQMYLFFILWMSAYCDRLCQQSSSQVRSKCNISQKPFFHIKDFSASAMLNIEMIMLNSEAKNENHSHWAKALCLSVQTFICSHSNVYWKFTYASLLNVCMNVSINSQIVVGIPA